MSNRPAGVSALRDLVLSRIPGNYHQWRSEKSTRHSISCWLVRIVTKIRVLACAPVSGVGSQWYKNVLKNSLIGIESGAQLNQGIPIRDGTHVSGVVGEFPHKYWTIDVKSTIPNSTFRSCASQYTLSAMMIPMRYLKGVNSEGQSVSLRGRGNGAGGKRARYGQLAPDCQRLLLAKKARG